MRALLPLLLFLAACIQDTPPCKEGHDYKESCVLGKMITTCDHFQCDIYEDCSQWRSMPEEKALQCLEYRRDGK
jgi:hypothetical protein